MVVILLIIIGLVLLQQGAGWFVDGSSGLARRFKVSELAIGLTIVSFGTSFPELVVNVFAALKGNDDIIFGNIIGSNNFNLFIILGIVGLISVVSVRYSTTRKEIPFSLISLMIFFFLANDRIIFNREISTLTRLDGIILLMLFSIFMGYVFIQLKKDPKTPGGKQSELRIARIIFLIIIGLAGLITGGHLVLNNAVKLAQQLGMSEKVIGLTIIAAGTSLPELATSVIAAARKNHDIAVGNIVGSNVFNILFILPVSTIISPLEFNPSFNADLYFLAGGTLVLFFAMYTGQKQKLDRWEAILLVAAFTAYTFFLLAFRP